MKVKQLLGTGLGFRTENVDEILETLPAIPWFEILIDNFMADNASLSIVDRLIEHYPVSFHGVGLNIGSTSTLDFKYLAKLRRLEKRWNPRQISDHFAWTATPEHRFHELMPLPFTEEAIQTLVSKIMQVQEYLDRQILLENSSSYVAPPSEMTEWEFINEVCSRSECGLLLDVNNIHVNAFNHGFLVADYIDGIQLSNVQEMHLAGYEDKGGYYFDSHGRPVADEVWVSYRQILMEIPNVPTLLEWDTDIPSLGILLDEINKAELIRGNVHDNVCRSTTSETKTCLAV